MQLVIGLGNSGKKYQNTRHNLGHLCVDALHQQLNLPPFRLHSKLASLLSKGEAILLAKNTGFMNESGYSVAKLTRFFRVKPANLFIIHDDLDLAPGDWKLQFGRGPAGHHGIESIIGMLQTQAFWRLRIGIGHPNDIPVEHYVLLPPPEHDQQLIATALTQAQSKLRLHLGL